MRTSGSPIPKTQWRPRSSTGLDGLPTPPFIARTDVDPAFVTTLKSELLAYKPHPTPSTLYAGFADYQSDAMQRFFAELETIPGMAAR